MLPFSSEVRILRKHSPMFVSTRISVTLSRTISFSGSFVPKRYFILLTTLPFFIRCIDKELSIPLISRISNRRDLRTVYTIRSLSFKNRTGNIPLAIFANNEIFHCTTCFHFAIIKLINIERDRRSFRMTHFNPLNLNFTIKAARLEYYKRAFSSEGTKINGLFFPFSSNLDILISRCIPITHFDNKFTSGRNCEGAAFPIFAASLVSHLRMLLRGAHTTQFGKSRKKEPSRRQVGTPQTRPLALRARWSTPAPTAWARWAPSR